MDEIMDMADLHSGRARHSLPHGHEGSHPDVSEGCTGVHYDGEEHTVASNPSHEHRHVRRQIDDPVLDGEVLRVNHV